MNELASLLHTEQYKNWNMVLYNSIKYLENEINLSIKTFNSY